jgi:hypothetical protein
VQGVYALDVAIRVETGNERKRDVGQRDVGRAHDFIYSRVVDIPVVRPVLAAETVFIVGADLRNNLKVTPALAASSDGIMAHFRCWRTTLCV